MLVAITASMAASIGAVVYSMDAPQPAAIVLGSRDEWRDSWTALQGTGGTALQWQASHPGVRYAVDDGVSGASPMLSTEMSPMPAGRVFSFCGDDVVEAWTFSVYSEGHLVSRVAFSVIMPCEG